MKVIRTIDEMRAHSAGERGAGRRIAFVPTMGALHDGHISLMREGKGRAETLIASIYVNPAQFGPGEDLERYPRSLEEDLAKCEGVGADAVFVPDDGMIYPDGFTTGVRVGGLTERLCGASRPGHFDGVTTVVAKLFNIVRPDIAVFGEKDYQQLVVIRRMVADLDMPVEIVGAPTVREADGLAMSSRNDYLSPDQREAATSLYRSLNVAQKTIDAGETDPATIMGRVRETIEKGGIMKIDYAELVSPDTLEGLSEFRRPSLIALAAYAGETRLIDNRFFG